jgi:hypothetical protein
MQVKKMNPGSKAKVQASVIAEGIRQYDEASQMLHSEKFDRISIVLS